MKFHGEKNRPLLPLDATSWNTKYRQHLQFVEMFSFWKKQKFLFLKTLEIIKYENLRERHHFKLEKNC